MLLEIVVSPHVSYERYPIVERLKRLRFVVPGALYGGKVGGGVYEQVVIESGLATCAIYRLEEHEPRRALLESVQGARKRHHCVVHLALGHHVRVETDLDLPAG